MDPRCRRVTVALFAFLVAAPLGLLGARPAAAEDPTFVNWAELAPSLSQGYDPTSSDDCRSGKLSCVDKVIRVMNQRLDRLAEVCSHDSLFALAYLRTTDEYRRAAIEPGFFTDTPFINHEDATFARYYFDAYDAWVRGDVASVPPAWRIALGASSRREVSGAGNVLLGISAHINRDLPFVLHDIGLVKPDGTSRKPDHDKVNVFLDRVEFYAEANRRFDPSLPTSTPPTMINVVMGWREEAWRNAERLAAATTAIAYDAEVRRIEDTAAMEAEMIRSSTAYGPLESSAARDAHCQAHWSDA